jgi:single-stranded DNA-binding protein
MNNLNSILLEGEVVGTRPLRYNEITGEPYHAFTIRSRRTMDGRELEESVTIQVVCKDKLSRRTSGELTIGRVIRVVGRIAHGKPARDVAESIHIVAEHVEFRA